jgi:U4/U6 small nuclear ribonucleoprotein PRP4
MRQPGDRRDRLKYVQEQISQARGADAVMGGDESSSDEDDEDEVCPSFALSM